MGDDAVHPHRCGQLLAEQPDRDLGDGEGVSGVDAQFGVGGRVRGLAAIADVLVVDGEGLGPGGVGRAGVDHHRGVQPVEGAALEHEDLPAAALLGGGANA